MKEDKPLISFILITYNQENFVKDALDGAFSQTYSPMEIIIADDGSKDKTPYVIEQTIAEYKGPHKVVFHRGSPNVGIAQNLNNAMALAKGEYFILAAGDDKSLPERAQRTYELFSQYPDLTCINFRSIPCNTGLKPLVQKQVASNSVSIINIYDYIDISDFVIWSGDARSIRRSLYDIFGPFVKGQDEDSTLFMRGLLTGTVGHAQECMSMRRTHDQQVSNFKNIRKHVTEDFIGQPMLDIEIALQKEMISKRTASEMRWKVCHADKILADQYYKAVSTWYRILYANPVNLLRRIKNKIFA